jgi:hypothetical protein
MLPAGTPLDVGVGSDTVERRIQATIPFRSADTVTELTVGSVRVARRALAISFAADIVSFAFCAAVFAWKVSNA